MCFYVKSESAEYLATADVVESATQYFPIFKVPQNSLAVQYSKYA